MLKIEFMGTPSFSVPILEALIEKYDVIAVVTQPDKIVGRKRELQASPVKNVQSSIIFRFFSRLRLDKNIKILLI